MNGKLSRTEEQQVFNKMLAVTRLLRRRLEEDPLLLAKCIMKNLRPQDIGALRCIADNLGTGWLPDGEARAEAIAIYAGAVLREVYRGDPIPGPEALMELPRGLCLRLAREEALFCGAVYDSLVLFTRPESEEAKKLLLERAKKALERVTITARVRSWLEGKEVSPPIAAVTT